MPTTPKFTQLACTGASYLTGITGDESFPQGSVYSSAFLGPYTVGAPTIPSGGAASVPPQFGDIASGGTPSQVNSVYTTANPNVVLVTLGADDLKFVSILTACIEWNYLPADLPSDNGHSSSPYGGQYSGNLQCSDDNDTDKKGPTGSGYPDGVIQDYYNNQLQALHTHLTSLLTAIEKEGRQTGQSGPPKVVITNYPNPLPDNLPQKDGSNWASEYCPDTFPSLQRAGRLFLRACRPTGHGPLRVGQRVPEDQRIRGQYRLCQSVQRGQRIPMVRRQDRKPQPKHT